MGIPGGRTGVTPPRSADASATRADTPPPLRDNRIGPAVPAALAPAAKRVRHGGLMVNPAIHAAHAAAAKARKDVLDRLRQSNATEVSNAVPIDGLARLQAQALEKL